MREDFFAFVAERLERSLGRSAPKLREALESLGELANAPEGLELQVSKIIPGRDGQHIGFRQVVRGIPCVSENHLNIDQNGHILNIESQLYNPASARQAKLISAAVTAIETQIKDRLDEHELHKPTDLFFYFEPPTQSLVPYYSVFIRAERTDGSWLVQINAYNGDARIADTPQALATGKQREPS